MGPQFVDINGDGLQDMMVVSDRWAPNQQHTYQDHVYLNNGHGWTLTGGAFSIPVPPAGNLDLYLMRPQFLDFFIELC
jgi:hypothetical protein